SASVAYDGYKQRFLVAWEDNRGGAFDIYGQLVRASDGALFNHTQPADPYNPPGSAGANFIISNAANGQYAPSVAYDSANRRFLAAWAHTSSVIFGQLINADGSLYDTASNVNFLIAADAISNNPAADFNPACGNFLTIFETTVSGVYDVGLAVVGPPCCTPPPSGMVAWWGGDNNALDMVGNNNGTLNGANYAAGKVGQAFSLDGVNDYVEMTGSSVGDFGSAPFTVDFWMYAINGTAGYLVGKSHPDSGLGWDIRWKNDNKIYVVGVNGWNWFTSDASATSNTWHHIAVASTDSLVTLYIDGVVKGTSPRSAISSTGNPFRMGDTTNYGDAAFNGLLDEVEIFNRALDASEITAIYNAGSTGKCRSCTPPPSNMGAWWKAEGNAADATDSHDGTLVNGTAFAAGKVGQAFSFDGVDDYVRAGLVSTAVDNITMDAWIYWNGSNSSFSNQLIFYNGLSSASGYGLYLTNGGLVVILRGGVAWVNSSTTLTPGGGWQHLALVRDNGIWSWYLNGVAQTMDSPALSPNTPTHYMSIGGQGGESFNGRIDEVEIFGRALTADEIAEIYNAGSAGKCFVSHNVNATSPGGNGSMSCTGPVLNGYDSTCTIASVTGYYLSGLTDNTIDVLGSVVGGTYTISNVTGVHNVVAAFAEYEIKRVSGSDYYYNLLSAAFGAVADTDVVMLRQGGLAAGEYNRPGVSITLRGGYDSGFGSNTGPATTLTGLLTIRAGSMTVEKIVIN
ncbi:MAG: LamG domain-containing protein, partial [Nitrospirae bacterium]|nr:LamG domain-containing protein [Nitrospirota bacterium]